MIKELILFTNRNCIGFDENGEQIPAVTIAISHARVDKKMAAEIINSAERIYISKFQKWQAEISKDEMFSLLGLMFDQVGGDQS